VEWTVPPPGFYLHRVRRLLSTLNYIRTGHGRCVANLVRQRQSSHSTCSFRRDSEARRWRLGKLNPSSTNINQEETVHSVKFTWKHLDGS